MSKVVDERVVSMQFDNRQFESNVRTTMSTLDKLKQSLNLSGASKGLEGVSAAASKCDLSPLGTAVDGVKVKFSAMQVMAVTALSNITNSAVNAGKRIVDSLTIAPIKTGFDEYELKMGAIQTIMASTGASLETVNKYLNELNEYSDQTIYSFQDMTTNIGKFTNAGVKLEDAVVAIKGIANEAAVSGANANEASRAMYNFSQALSTGYVQRIDWKSIELANMATVEFKEQLLAMAVEMKTVEKNAEGMYKAVGDDQWYNTSQMFIESLDEQWLTSEVLIKTLKEYASETTDIGKKAKAAATEVKTFSMLMDTLKEAAQSGWAQTWELLVGDFDEAKELFTKLSNVIGGWLDKMSDTRNTIIGALVNISKPWETITTKMKDSGLGKFVGFADKITEIGDKVANVTKSLEEFQSIVSKVWHGDYGNSDTGRFELLESQGWDHRVVQDLVNKGSAYKLTIEDVEASHKKFGLTLDSTAESMEKVVAPVEELTDAKLKDAGLTDTEIRLYRELEAEADRLGISVDTLVQKMSRKDGRAMLLESLSNAFSGIAGIFKAIGRAWSEIFPPISIIRLYSIIEGINKFSKRLRMFEPEIEKLTRVFKGLFAVLDIVLTVVGGPLKIAFKILGQLLSVFDVNILDLAANIGDALVKFRDWVDSVLDFTGVFEKIAPVIQNVVDKIKNFFKSIKEGTSPINDIINNIRNWIASLKDAENLPEAIARGIANGIGKIIGAIKKLFSGMKDGLSSGFEGADSIGDTVVGKIAKGIWNGLGTVGQVFVELGKIAIEKLNETLEKHGFKKIPTDLIRGFVNGIKDGAVKAFEVIIEFGKQLLAKFRGILGIESPSKETYSDGTNFIVGFINGVKDFAAKAWDAIKNFGHKAIEALRNVFSGISVSDVITIAITSGLIVAAVKIAKFMSPILDVAKNLSEGISNLFGGIGSMFESFGDAAKIKARAKMIRNIGIALLLLAASIYIIAQLEWEQIKNGLIALGAIAGGLLVLVGVMGLLSKFGIEFTKGSACLVALALAIVGIAYALKIMDTIDGDNIWRNAAVLGVVTLGLVVLTALLSKLAPSLSKGSLTMIAIAAAILLLVTALSKIDALQIQNPDKLFTTLLAIVAGLALVSFAARGIKAGSAIGLIGIVLALKMFVNTIQSIAEMDTSAIMSSLNTIMKILGMFALLMVASAFAGSKTMGAGVGILAISVALYLIIGAIRILAWMSPSDLSRGLDAVTQIMLVFSAVMVLSKFAGKNAMKAGVMLLAMSAALLILSGVMVIISLIDPTGLGRAMDAITQIMLLFALLVVASHFASDAKGTIIAMGVVMVLLVAAVVVLTRLSQDDLTRATASLTAIIAVFALLIFATKFINTAKGATLKTIGTLLVLTGMIVILAHVIAKLSEIPAQSALTSVAALALLLVAMAAAIKLLGGIKSVPTEGLFALYLLVPVIWILGEIIRGLQDLDPAHSLGMVLSLSAMLLAMSAVCVACAMVGKVGKGALTGVATLDVLLLSILGIMMGLGALLEYTDWAGASLDATIGFMKKLATELGPIMPELAAMLGGLVVVAGVCAVLGVVGPMALAGVAAFDVLIVSILGIMMGLGALIEYTSWAGPALDAAIEFIKKLATGLGEAIGGFVSGVLSSITDTLPKMGDDLSAFADSLVPFINTMKTIDSSAIAGIQNVTDMILKLTAVDLVSKLTSWLPGEGSMEDITKQLVPFGESMVKFSDTIAGKIDVDAVNAASSAGMMIAELQNSLGKTGGLWQDMFGETDFDAFTAQLVPFGHAMVAFSDIVAGNIDADAVQCAADAGSIMASLANSLPKDYGAIAGLFKGEPIPLDTFGGQLVHFGRAMVRFSSIVSEGDIDTDAVQCAADAGSVMAALANSLPKEYGAIAGLFKSEPIPLDEFGGQLVLFGRAMVSFSRAVSGNIDTAAVETAASAGTMMNELATKLPKEPGAIKALFVDSQMNFEDFGKQLVAFGNAIVDFSAAVSGNIDVDAVGSVARAARSIVDTLLLTPEIGGLDAFKTSITEFGNTMVSFNETIEGIDNAAITTVANAALDLAEAASIMPNYVNFNTLTTGLSGFANAMVSLSDKITGEVDLGMINTISAAGTAIANMAAAIPPTTGYSSFSANIVGVGEAIVEFSQAISGATIDEAAVERVTALGSQIGDMMMNLTGYSDITDFVANAKLLGESLAAFSGAVDEGAVDTAAITSATVAGNAIGTMISNIAVYDDLTEFINNAAALGQAIVDFSAKVKDNVDMEAITNATTAGTNIGNMIASFAEWKDMSTFIENSSILADAIVDFSSTVDEGAVDPVSVANATTAGRGIVSLLDRVGSGYNVDSAVSAMQTLGPAVVEFADTVSEVDLSKTASAVQNFKELATAFGDSASKSVDSFVKALTGAKTKVADSISAFAKGAISNIKAHYGSDSTGFYGAGKYLVQGFANGISAYTYMATAKSSAMALAALEAAKEALGINSPSKEFIKIGKGVPEGFAMGVDKLGSLVDKSVVSMADGALKGTKDVISRIAGYVDSDIDSQPTIRPVLDLSAVSSGVNQIGSMFNMSPSLGVLANVGSISSMMNNRKLASGSDDIVSAIKDLGRFGGDTYNINGISYDENSDVADAIRTLTRAARMERRI